MYCCHVWDPINGLQKLELENIQSHALRIIRGANSGSYNANLRALELQRLSDRRLDLVKRFAIKTYRDPRHRWWFKITPASLPNTREEVPRFSAPNTRNKRGDLSPMYAYVKCLNELSHQEWIDWGLPPPLASNDLKNTQLRGC